MESQPPAPSPFRLPQLDSLDSSSNDSNPPEPRSLDLRSRRHDDEHERADSMPPRVAARPEPREPDGLDRVLSIPLTLHVELGRKRMRIAELLALGAGQVLTLEVAAGTPLTVYANGTLVAEGEAVVVGDRYGIRITQIVSPEERVARLGGKEVR